MKLDQQCWELGRQYKIARTEEERQAIRKELIKTDMTSVVTAKYDKLISEGLCLIPRWGYPEDIGKAVAMLWRGDLAYTTGQVLMIDGGMTISQL